MNNIEEEYQKFKRMSTKNARDFIMSLPLSDRLELIVYISNKTKLLISDIMNSLGIWKLG